MIRVRVVALALALGLVVAVMPISVGAQPICDRGAVTQFDLAGYYASDSMSVSVYPCGGVYVEWVNAYGSHGSTYITMRHLSDGVIAQGVTSTTGFLDNSTVIGIKAADPGYVQIITDGPLGARVYRLRKMY